jgi:RNA polymerase sigma-70 factor (ECF subfamily)
MNLERSTHMLLDLIASADKTPSRSAASHEAVEAMRAALTELPPDYRKAVQLVYIEGRSVAEAASEMGRTDRAIHNLCYKAKEHLRDLLGSASRFLSQSG